MHPATLFTIPTIFARAQGLMGLRQCHGVSQGADKRKILPMEEIAVEFIVLDNKKRRPFHLKDNIMSPNGKLARRLNLIAPKKAKHRKRRKTRISLK